MRFPRESDVAGPGGDGEELPPITHYRLRGRQPTVVLTDPTTDMILSRVEAGKAVREAELDDYLDRAMLACRLPTD